MLVIVFKFQVDNAPRGRAGPTPTHFTTIYCRNGLSPDVPMSHAAGAPESWGLKFESLYLPDRILWQADLAWTARVDTI